MSRDRRKFGQSADEVSPPLPCAQDGSDSRDDTYTIGRKNLRQIPFHHNDESILRNHKSRKSPRPMYEGAPKHTARTHQAWLSSLFAPNSSAPRTPPAVSRDTLMSPPETRRLPCSPSLFGCAPPQGMTEAEPNNSTLSSPFPIQAYYHRNPPKVSPVKAPFALCHYEIVGHPCLNIYRLRLPSHLLHLLNAVVIGCEEYAAMLPDGWLTDLYSLTKQDIALREIPHIYNAARPIVSYIKRSISLIYGVPSVRMDRNQPHVLKYSAERGGRHRGVELHHDKCDYTANLMLSKRSSYTGGGTFFPDANQTIRLEFGEFLLHPGGLVHSGVEITGGNRYLMVIFAHAKRNQC